jgi:class 3 adenylate cyclase
MISFGFNEALARHYGDADSRNLVKKAFEFSQISEALEIEMTDALLADCCVVFSDISGFARRTSGKSAEQIKAILENYYSCVLPIIYSHGGLVDQMFGDGTISVFSTKLSCDINGKEFDLGLSAAEDIVKQFAGNATYSTKCALHKGKAVICEIGDDNYKQATLVGEVMTIVHRVEAAAKDEAVNMLHEIPEAKAMYERITRQDRVQRLLGSRTAADWSLGIFMARLKGVGNEQHEILYEKYNG